MQRTSNTENRKTVDTTLTIQVPKSPVPCRHFVAAAPITGFYAARVKQQNQGQAATAQD